MFGFSPVQALQYAVWDLKGDIFGFFIVCPPEYNDINVGLFQVLAIYLTLLSWNLLAAILGGMIRRSIFYVLVWIFSHFFKFLIFSFLILVFYVAMGFLYSFLLKTSFDFSMVYIGLLSSIHLPIVTLIMNSSESLLDNQNVARIVSALTGILSGFLANRALFIKKKDEMRFRRLFLILIVCGITGIAFAVCVPKYLFPES